MHVHIISVPYDSGRRSVRMGNGPQFLLEAGLREFLESLGHDTTITEIHSETDAFTPEPAIMLDLNRQVARVVSEASAEGMLPLVLSGSCYTAVGTVTALGCDHTGVFWFDSHGDFNTPETSGSGFLDGMAIAMLTGRCWRQVVGGLAGYRPVPEGHIRLVGARDIDPPEQALLDESAIEVLGPGRIDRDLPGVLNDLPGVVDQVYLHLDLDVLDPDIARANSLAAPRGPDTAQAMAAISRIGAAFPIRAIALTAFDPGVGDGARVSEAARRLIAAALGGIQRPSPRG